MAEQVTLTLPDNLAERAHQIAASTQRGLEEVLLEWLDLTSHQFPSQPSPEIDEVNLLRQVNLGFSADWWNRYRSLIAERQAETISETDLAELIKISETLEIANAKRIEALGKLAQLRGSSIEQVMQALEIELQANG